MMLTATPERNPIITEFGTNLVYRPNRATPAAIMSAPASTVRRNSARGRSASATVVTAEPAASAAALVVVITMSRVLEVSPPPIGPKTLA
jgi:hypothetical protein